MLLNLKSPSFKFDFTNFIPDYVYFWHLEINLVNYL